MGDFEVVDPVVRNDTFETPQLLGVIDSKTSRGAAGVVGFGIGSSLYKPGLSPARSNAAAMR